MGPTLWNALFDEVLNLEIDPVTHSVAYADDLAVVTSSDTKAGLTRKVNHILTKMDDKVPPKYEVKYLGVIIDRLRTFGRHIFYVAGKAKKTAAALSRLLPNIGGPIASKRRVMAQAVTSTLMYAAPVWEKDLRVGRYRRRLEGVQRRMALRVASAYKTVSLEASLVIIGMIPLHILVEETRRIFEVDDDPTAVRKRERIRSFDRWQEEFENGIKGRWTYTLIKNVKNWSTRKHGEINYHISQFLTGHGNFRMYLHRIGKRTTDERLYCGDTDTPEHAILFCPREEVMRTETGATIQK